MNPSAASTVQRQQHERQSLKAAFDEFNRLSRQLQQSYEDLQQRTGELNLNWLPHPEFQTDNNSPLTSRIEILLATLPVAVIVINSSGIIITANRSELAYSGDSFVAHSFGVHAHSLISIQYRETSSEGRTNRMGLGSNCISARPIRPYLFLRTPRRTR